MSLRPLTKDQMLETWAAERNFVLRQSPQMRVAAELAAAFIAGLGLFFCGLTAVQHHRGLDDDFTWRNTLLISATCWLVAGVFLVFERMNCVRVSEGGLRENYFPVGRGRLIAWAEVDRIEIQTLMTLRMVIAVLVSGGQFEFAALEVGWSEQKTGRAWRSYQEDVIEVLNSIVVEMKAQPGFVPLVPDLHRYRVKALVRLIAWLVGIVAVYVLLFSLP